MALTGALDVPLAGARPRFDRQAGALIGGRCAGCGAVSWPLRAVCHRCGDATLEPTAFAARGTLISHTTVWVGPDALAPPYTIGQVMLDDGPLIFGHVRGLAGDAAVPLLVRLRLAAGADAVPPFWFEPEGAE